ncbi:DNA repair and recombination protein RAD54 and RAD54-like protein [Echinococcus granulosus]|uniref:DNA repair and recombination protein RAD54 and RAD54-like protein n=1 Tax=Echinococcus granulosus TaxID=6210 RepID=W6U1E9_ECHGR|nr:DNA repair and recombination protein RAD54 and RAD54-like protein [Echinococcus granulosus]EUB54336.1 DNA repair and recombination protein RAD54 and RAD54-like protein [Echinococcus granulosus]
MSDKFHVLDCLLTTVRTTSSDKTVVILNYAQALDLFENKYDHEYGRLLSPEILFIIARRCACQPQPMCTILIKGVRPGLFHARRMLATTSCGSAASWLLLLVQKSALRESSAQAGASPEVDCNRELSMWDHYYHHIAFEDYVLKVVGDARLIHFIF